MYKSVDGVLGIQTCGSKMEGTDESTELWQHPNARKCKEVMLTLVTKNLSLQVHSGQCDQIRRFLELWATF